MGPNSILRPVLLPTDLVGRPAPCDLFSAGGLLLLRAGSPIIDGREDPSQPLRFHCPAPFAARICHANPTRDLVHIAHGLEALAQRLAVGSRVSANELQEPARKLVEVWRFDPDACLGFARLSRHSRASVRHVVHVGLLALEVGTATGIGHDGLTALAGAALSMNLTRLALHDEMFNVRGFPDSVQRQAIHDHPIESVALLHRLGHGCEEWIPAVVGHHENIDGSGYPLRLRGAAISLPARILRVADTLAARITGRKTRAPLYWNLSHANAPALLARHVFGDDLALLDKSLINQLMRVLGPFPPGCLVRLSNRELAVVTRRGLGGPAKPRQVLAVADPAGRLLEMPILRKLGNGLLAIRAYAQDESSRLEAHAWHEMWGYDR